MSDCSSIDPLITPYVDGQLATGERDIVHQHLRACPPCHARVGAEQAMQGLLSARKATLLGGARARRATRQVRIPRAGR